MELHTMVQMKINLGHTYLKAYLISFNSFLVNLNNNLIVIRIAIWSLWGRGHEDLDLEDTSRYSSFIFAHSKKVRKYKS